MKLYTCEYGVSLRNNNDSFIAWLKGTESYELTSKIDDCINYPLEVDESNLIRRAKGEYVVPTTAYVTFLDSEDEE